jgi:hypothetical protein
MKIHWGYKIMIVYLFFVVGMVVLVIKSTMQKFELVQPDYYADELKYQTVIDASQRAKNFQVELNVLKQAGKLNIMLPKEFSNKKVTGKAHLYYAADIQKDIVKKFDTNNGTFTIETFSTTKGNYTLKLEVMKEGVSYYYEQKIFL